MSNFVHIMIERSKTAVQGKHKEFQNCVAHTEGVLVVVLILNTLRSTLNMSVSLCSPAAVQKEVEGKALDYIIRIIMSLICFSRGCIICKKKEGYCHSISV